MTAVEDALAEHRRELHVHCYRMLASYHDAEDAVQETALRAWRSRDTFEGEHVRAWLYKIATNVCLDRSRSRARRPVVSTADLAWLTPYPDTELDPHESYVARETIELAFLAALQALPPRQRAALLAREVLGLSAAETAAQVGTTVAAANSALQRARETMRAHLPSRRSDWRSREPNPQEKELLAAFIDAHERQDAAAALAVATTDLRITMPPNPWRYDGVDVIGEMLAYRFGAGSDGDWRLLPTAANRMPAAASYLRRPGDSEFRAFKLDLLRVEGDRVAEITTFGPTLFGALGLPEVLA